MNTVDEIAVCSRSFSRSHILRAELLEKYRNVNFNEDGKYLEGDRLVNFIGNSSKAIIGLEVINQDVLTKLPNLKVISKFGVGLDSLDVKYIKNCGVRVGWVGGVNRRSVSELALTFALMLIRDLAPDRYISTVSDVSLGGRGSELSSKAFGIIGCGNIGKDFVQLLKPFGCKIFVCDPMLDQTFANNFGLTACSLEYLLRHSDIVSLHIPLTEGTRNIISDREFWWMKDGSYIINTARGGLVDEAALKHHIKLGRIAGAALDVLANEPDIDQELVSMQEVILTPHVGGSSREGILAMGRAAIASLDGNWI